MKKYLLIVFSILFVLYFTTAFVFYDIAWITKIESYSDEERLLIAFSILFICILSKGIKSIHYEKDDIK